MPYQDKQGRLCGFLNIEETENSSSFCRRYFVLDQNNGKLVYYMDSLGNLPEAWKSPVGEIYMHSISQVSNGDAIRPKLPFCLIISVAGRQYFLQAETKEDKWQWIEAIKNASKITVPLKSQKSPSHTEWRAVQPQESYITEIAGGVVCKMPVPSVDADSDSNSEDDESRSSSSGRVSPTSLMNRGLHSFTKDIGSSLEPHKKLGNIQDVQPMKTGYCVKQGAVRKSWKRRFFTLHSMGLSYSKSEQDKQPIRTIPLQDILESRPSDGTQIHRDNLFEVLTSKRIFYIQCDTPEDMTRWIEAIRAAIRQRRLEERKSMQDPSGRHPLEEELRGGSYPSPIWKHRFMSAKERGSKDSNSKQVQKKSFILW